MKQHQYEITVKHVADAQGQPSTYIEALQFTAYNHDDLFKVLERIQQGELFEGDKAIAFGIGLKLFGETMLENKNHPLFKDLFPQFIELMKSLKQSIKAKNTDQIEQEVKHGQ